MFEDWGCGDRQLLGIDSQSIANVVSCSSVRDPGQEGRQHVRNNFWDWTLASTCMFICTHTGIPKDVYTYICIQMHHPFPHYKLNVFFLSLLYIVICIIGCLWYMIYTTFCFMILKIVHALATCNFPRQRITSYYYLLSFMVGEYQFTQMAKETSTFFKSSNLRIAHLLKHFAVDDRKPEQQWLNKY